jgi:HEAT repeat protein
MPSLREWVTQRKARGFLSQLMSLDPTVSTAAADRLVAMGPPAVPFIVDELKHGQARMRASAALVLGQMRHAATIPELADHLADPDHQVRVAAERALAEMGGLAVPVLLTRVGNADGAVRRTAAMVLGEIGDPRAIQPLILALSDEDIGVRQSAAEALGALKADAAIPSLVKLLQDPSPVVRSSALTGLDRMGTPAALDALHVWREQQAKLRC